MSGGAGEASSEVDQVQVVNNDTENMLPGSNKLIPDIHDDKAAAEAKEEVDCEGAASLWSTVDPKCIQLKPTPALTNLFTAAIYGPVSEAGAEITSEIASDALEATGNAALVQLATTSAFTPEQVALLEKMSNSDDPKVREAVKKIQSRLSNAVAEGIETARKTVVPPLEKATGEIANGMIVSFLNAVSDIPGVGVVLSALGLIDTAVKAASSATDIVEKAQEAAKPVTDAIDEVQDTVGKLASAATESVSEAPQNVNEATESVSVAPPSVATESVSVAPPSVTPPSVNVAPPSVSEAPQSVSEAPQSVSEAPQSVSVAPQSVSVAPQSVSEAPQSVATESVSVAPQSVATESVNEAPPSVNEAPPSVTPPSVTPPSVAPQSVSEAPQSVSVAPQSVSEAPPSVSKATESVSVTPQSVNVAPPSVAPRSVPLNYNRELHGPHQNDYPEGDKGYAEFEAASKKFQEDKQKKRDSANAAANAAAKSAIAAAKSAKMHTGRVVDAQVITHDNQGITVGYKGGSRKRRRIHKLSRRIERTLRRVQKKYGLKDKGDFLRRTLKR
jgi:hypothetical protein